MADFWQNRIIESGAANPEELAKGMNPLNWRGHPEAQREALEEALDSLGILQPVLFNKSSGRVVDGHLRIELALLKGQPLIPVNYVELTDDEEMLALATLDAITEQAQPIPEKLAALMERTKAMVADRPGLAGMLAELKAKAGVNGKQAGRDVKPQIDKAAQLKEKWGTALGQVWQLGEHRLACGDCTERAVVESVMRGEKAALCVTSPPYWVGREYEKETGEDEIKAHIVGAVSSIVCAMDDLPHIAINTGTTTQTKQGGQIREVWLLIDWWADAFRRFDIVLRNLRIWGKRGGWTPFSPAQDVVDLNWEFLASFTKTKPKPQNKISESWALDGIWDCQPQTENVNHSAPFPVEIPSRYIQLYTSQNDIVLETYSGSGTTLIACENLGRKCRAIELDPGYVAVALQRWADLTGLTPTLTGRYE